MAHRAQSRTYFYYHTLLYVMANLVLVALNLVLTPIYPWAILPVVIRGIAVVAHYMVAFRWMKSANAQWMAQAEYLAGELHRASEVTPEKAA